MTEPNQFTNGYKHYAYKQTLQARELIKAELDKLEETNFLGMTEKEAEVHALKILRCEARIQSYDGLIGALDAVKALSEVVPK